MERLRQLWAEAQARYQALSTRERRLVTIAGGAVLAFALFFTLFSFSQSASAYQRRTALKLSKLKDAQDLANTYRESERQRQMVERSLTTNAVQLISYVEDKGTAAGLDVPTMNPKGDQPIGDGKIIESAVELTFTDVPLRKLYDFLNSIERGPGIVKVKYVRLEPRVANETVTAWTTIATYRLKQ